MKKRLLIILLLLFSTGCSVKYNIEFDKDLKISESFDVKETDKYFEREYTYYEKNDAIESLWNVMGADYSNVGYQHEVISNGIKITNNYNSLNDYINKTTLYKQYFENISYDENDNIVIIETTGSFYPYNAQDLDKFAVENLEINVKIPYKVIDNNADDVQNNIYTWKIDKETKDKKIYIKLDKSKLEKQKGFVIDFSILFGIIVVGTIMGIYVYYRIKRDDDVI